jgi:hypothetical protein
MNLDEFEKSGRKNIIQTAVEKMKTQYPHFNLEDPGQVRIYASDRTVRVILGIALISEPAPGGKWVMKTNYETVFREDEVICYPFNPRESFKLDEMDKKLIALTLKDRSLSLDVDFSIVERMEYYVITFVWKLTGECKGYDMNKKNGQWELKNQKPPEARPAGSMPHIDLGIDDKEIFREITE